MYTVKNDVSYKLYDKEKGEVVGTFDSMYEVRDFVASQIVFHDDVRFDGLSFEFSTVDGYYILKDLSMDFEKRYRTVRVGLRQSKLVPYKNLVILTDNGGIFNYTEIVDELVAMHRGNKITFGIGKTYSGNPETPKNWRNRPIHYRGMLGAKRHPKGSGSYKLIVNKRERANAQPKFHGNGVYADILEEITEVTTADVNITMIKSAYNSMRDDRRKLSNNVWEDGYTDQHYKYGRPESWKNHRKTRQWCREKNTHRFRSKYIGDIDTTDIEEMFNTSEHKEVA